MSITVHVHGVVNPRVNSGLDISGQRYYVLTVNDGNTDVNIYMDTLQLTSVVHHLHHAVETAQAQVQSEQEQFNVIKLEPLK